MGLASALTTALTGMTAAETQIDVIGNNIANSQTVGFKSSTVVFSTQFLQTTSLGSSPSESSGGTNPRQTGLGTTVSEITPDFTQGTIEISSNSSDLAIQGDGFFIVEGTSGEQLYTRNGEFRTNSDNELVTVEGYRVLGYGVDESFNIQTTELVALEIPIGSTTVAQATQNVYLEGTLTPDGDVATVAEVIESAILGDAATERADASDVTISVAPVPSVADTDATIVDGTGGTHEDDAVYSYCFAFVDDSGTETLVSSTVTYTVTDGDAIADNSTILLTDIPQDASYTSVNIYRTENGGSDFYLLDNVAMGETEYEDDNLTALSTTALPDQDTLDGNYSYVLTYYSNGEEESRPSLELGPLNVVDGRIQISNLPTPDGEQYDEVRIYRTVGGSTDEYYLVATLEPGESFTDSVSDEEISDLEISGNQTLDMDGPKIDSNTLLVDVIKRDSLDYEYLFSEGTLSFTGRKGERSLETQELEITDTTTVQDLIDFMEESLGIQTSVDDSQNEIPGSENNIAGESGELQPGIEIVDGQLRIVSNNGVDSAISVPLSAFQLESTDGTVVNPNLSFGSIQEAVGETAVTDFVVYDSLGSPLNVRVTMVLESQTGSATTYRWYADSSDNDPLTGSEISVGTGLVTFDGEGNLLSVTNSTVSIERRNSPATSPLEFDLDFSEVSGLAAESSDVAASGQDGFSTGTLTSFTISEDGIIRGIFDNGVTRDLGQIRLARFGNATGLEQKGENLYATSANSGLPVEGNPGEQGIGSLVAGAVELSNTDVGANLIDLVLATTQYRGNTRVISTAQELLDELLNLQR